ncbi:RNA polymerase sigma factor [Phycisphaerae bacterium RAS1]|nr:RNA polymerase sigma factor [Phycisphaerae bacterium RAS1]
MSTADNGMITQLLHAAGRGDRSAAQRLWNEVYEELRRLARRQLAGEGPRCTIQTTSLVHEAYMRLVGSEQIEWENHRHFFGAAARAMRQIRVDDARRRGRIKRGGDQAPAPLVDDAPIFDDDPAEILSIDEALKILELAAPRQAEIVTHRYYSGLSVDETAAALGVSPRTVDTEWRFARAWLHRELTKGDTQTQQDASP